MAAMRGLAGPLLFLNFLLYVAVIGFASWNLNHFIHSATAFPVAGNGATFYFLIFALLAGVLGVMSKLAGGNHIKSWRNDSLSAAIATAVTAWAVTALAFGLACKEINIGGYRGWRLRVLEGLIIVVGFTQLLYLMALHAGIVNSKYGPGYRNAPMYGPAGGSPGGTDPSAVKGTTGSTV